MTTKEDRLVMAKSADVASREIAAHIGQRKRNGAAMTLRTTYKCPEVGGLELRVMNKGGHGRCFIILKLAISGVSAVCRLAFSPP